MITKEQLITDLTKKTQELKKKFIQMTKDAAKRMFDHYIARNQWTLDQWYDAYGIKYTYVMQCGVMTAVIDRTEYHKKNYYKVEPERTKVKWIVKNGYEYFEAEEVKYAERHYKDSIEKLAYRLEQKGILTTGKYKIKNEWIGVNLHLTIEHDNQITKAWTIIAEGPIKRAHYRYLIK